METLLNEALVLAAVMAPLFDIFFRSLKHQTWVSGKCRLSVQDQVQPLRLFSPQRVEKIYSSMVCLAGLLSNAGTSGLYASLKKLRKDDK